VKKKKLSYCHIEHVELRRLLSTVFVDATAPGSTHDGSSWATAYTDLQVALAAATSGTTIEVGQGTYKPTAGADRTVSFSLKTGVTLLGGYAGTGQSNPDARNPALYPSILSGNIGAAGNSDNSYHVLYARNVDTTGVLDGFTITAGNANGGGNNSSGGGIFNLVASPTLNDCTISGNASAGSGAGVANLYSTATLTNCTISGNTAVARGGGVYNYQASPTLTNCTIFGNTANDGGGVSDKKYSFPTITDCILSGNTAHTGGGIANYNSSATLTDCVLAGNTSTENGGGIWNNNSSPVLVNCTISGNTAPAGEGGGMYNSFTSYPALTNCTFSGNSARYGGAIYNNTTSSPILTNSILWDDTASVTGDEIVNSTAGTNSVNATFSDIDQSGFAGSNSNIDADPHFIRAVETGGPGDFGNLRLQSNSPVIAAGNASAAGLSGVTTDQDGLSRTISGHIDMGAFESHYTFQSTIFVDASATGTNTGSTWANAYHNLAAALDYAVPGETIDVAQGTYYATSDGNRVDTFQLVDGVSVEGGFAGQANPAASRDVSAHPTILSGDIGTPGAIADNTYNVVTGSSTNNTAVLDGFTITAGYASGYHPTGGGIVDFSGSPTITSCTLSGNTSTGDGAGMFNYQSSPILNDCTFSGNMGRNGGGIVNEHYSSPVLTDCTISGNTTTQDGGGIYNYDHSSPTLIHCNISDNSGYDGGAMYNGSFSSPTLTNCTLSGNTATDDGGAMRNVSSSSPTLTNCTLSGNTASNKGGGLYDVSSSNPTLTDCSLTGNTAPNGAGGGMFNNQSSPTLTNCLLSGNTSYDDGGGIYNFGGSNPTLTNCTLTQNTAERGGGISNEHSSSTLTNCILWGDTASEGGNEMNIQDSSTATITHSDVKGGFAGAGNINADPLFLDATDGNFHLQHASPAINVGSNAAVPGGITTDLDGNPRIVNNIVDMGAYESPAIIYVDASATGAHNGSSWADAFTTLTAALSSATAGSGQTIEVAQGTYKPTTTSDRTATFQLIDGVSLEGGFAGHSNPNAAQNASVYPSILSGDIGAAGSSDNSYHVVNGSGTDSTAVLDGFTVTGGNADGLDNTKFHGGGIFIYSGDPTINDCIITGNTAVDGGGIYENIDVGAKLTGCVITGNTANDSGGGLYIFNTTVTLINTVIAGNSAERGGGLWDDDSAVTLTNCTISGNTASTSTGGGLYGAFGSDTLTNCVLWGDTAHTTGNEIQNGVSNTLTVSNSDIDQTGFAGSNNNIDADPMFVRSVGTNGSTDFGDLHLIGSSPAINAGSNAAISGTTTDLDGNSRIIEAAVDMGAYEAFPNHLVISTQPGATDTAGADIPIIVRVEDQYGDIFAADNSSVAISFANSPTGATLGGTSSVTAQHGVATFNAFSLAKAGSYLLSFSNGSLPIATSNSFTVTPSSPASLTITQQPANAVAGNAISPVTVQVEDQFGNPVDGASVNLSIASGPAGSTLGGTLNASTATNGQATFSSLTLNRAGTFTLSAHDGSLPGATTDNFAITYSRPQLVFTAVPTSVAAGAKISTIRISTEDVHGTPITSNKTSIKLTVSLGGKIISTITAMVKKGVATFSPPAIQKSGTYKLTATDPSSGPTASTTFSITAAAATKIAFNSQTFKVTHNKPFNVAVKLFDRYGNLATNDNSTVKLLLASHPAKTTLIPMTAAVTNGMADFVGVTLSKSGQYSLEVTDKKLKAVTGTFIVK
jgi:parallel beta-helix repeat protein